jgi:hypothetical protein
MPGLCRRHVAVAHTGGAGTGKAVPTPAGSSRTIASETGTEFTSNAILKFADDRKFDWHFIAL